MKPPSHVSFGLILAIGSACSGGDDWSRDLAAFDVEPATLQWNARDREHVLPIFAKGHRLDVREHSSGAIGGERLFAYLAVQHNTGDVADTLLKGLDRPRERDEKNEFERRRAVDAAVDDLRRIGASIPKDAVLWTQELDALGEYDVDRRGFALHLPGVGFEVVGDERDGPLDPDLLAFAPADAEGLLPELDELDDDGKRLLDYRLENWALANGPADALAGLPGRRTIRVFRALRVVGRNHGSCVPDFLCAYDADLLAIVLATPGGRVLYASADDGTSSSTPSSEASVGGSEAARSPQWLLDMLREPTWKAPIDQNLPTCVGQLAPGAQVRGWSVVSAVDHEAGFEATLTIEVLESGAATTTQWSGGVELSPAEEDPATRSIKVSCAPPGR